MIQVNVTEFRNHLPTYLERVKKGEEVALTSRGRVIGRVIPEPDESLEARKWLEALRSSSRVGDVTSPLELEWEAVRDSP